MGGKICCQGVPGHDPSFSNKGSISDFGPKVKMMIAEIRQRVINEDKNTIRDHTEMWMKKRQLLPLSLLQYYISSTDTFCVTVIIHIF